MRRSAVVMVASVLVLAGGSTTAGSAPGLPAAALPSAPASDAEIVGVLAAIHAVNLAAAQMGLRGATDERVRSLAEAIARHAREGERREAALTRRAGLRATDGDTRKGLKFAAKRAFPELPGRGEAFDRAWLDGQIETLTLVIGTINNKARPYAQGPGLREELVVVVEEAAADLAQAMALQKALVPTS